MSIRAVCFDFQDTLAYMTDSNWSPYTLAAAEYDVQLPDEAFSVVLDDAWARWRTSLGIDHSQASTDERSFRAARALVHEARLRVAGVDERLVGAMAERINDIECDPQHYHLFDDTAPALERLAAAGVQAIVVSNHNWRLPEIVGALGIGSRVEGVLTSARVGYRKPHPEMYAAALRLAACEPGDVLFVGDNPEHDVEGPRAAGMRAVLLDRGGVDGRADVIGSLLAAPLT